MNTFLLTGSYRTHLPIHDMNLQAKRDIKQDARCLKHINKIKKTEILESKVRFIKCNIIDMSTLQVSYG